MASWRCPGNQGAVSYTASMKRTQISLTEDEFKALKAQASVERRSMADLVRDAVHRYLAPRRPGGHRALVERLAGIGKAPGLRGEDHDDIYRDDR